MNGFLSLALILPGHRIGKGSAMLRIVLIVLVFQFTIAPLVAVEWTGNVNLLLGVKQLDDDDWGEEFERQAAAGVLVDFRPDFFPVNFVIDILASSDEESDGDLTLQAGTSEIAFGMRRYFAEDGLFRPFIGGGLTILQGHSELRQAVSGGTFIVEEESDDAAGFWLSAGAVVVLSGHFNLGAMVRHARAEGEWHDGEDIQLGGTHYGLLLGYHW